MKIQVHYLLILVAWAILFPLKSDGQCASNIGFENGNFTSWITVTDSNFITPASRQYLVPGINMGVINYGGTDAILGSIFRANSNVGNKLIKVGNRTVQATADTVYRQYIIDSLSDKLTIYSYGVVELAHNYWGVPTIEAPGFGYEIFVNGQKLDCLKGAFFCGNVDQPAVWQLGTYTDSGGVRKSTNWGAETLNFACYVGDTVELRLFTRDCILLGHYAYAYFDVVCGDTSKPVISQISFSDFLAEDSINLFCTSNATLYLQPSTFACPLSRSNVIWSPQSYITGSNTNDSVNINVPDSTWIYAHATFSNHCQAINIIDSIFVRHLNYDNHDNVPKLDINYCDCNNDTIDFSDMNVINLSSNGYLGAYINNKGLLIYNPCDNFFQSSIWKNKSSRVTSNANGGIGVNSWSSGNVDGAASIDSLTGAGTFRFVVDITSGKSFYIGLNKTNTSNSNSDLDQYLYINGTNITSYYKGSSSSNLGSYSGTITIDFEIDTSGRVRIYINNALKYTYSNSRLAAFPVFADYSANSNSSNHIVSSSFRGSTTTAKNFNTISNKTNQTLYINYLDRCGSSIIDTINFIPGLVSHLLTHNFDQCGLDNIQFKIHTTAPSLIDRISWTSNGTGNFTPPSGNGNLQSSSTTLGYQPGIDDYTLDTQKVIITTKSGSCEANDTAYIQINEIPIADAGIDISTNKDTFNLGGNPSGKCNTCDIIKFNWSQGMTLNDSTISNPKAYKHLLKTPKYIITVYDSTTGCHSYDTSYVYFPLNANEIELQTKCINEHLIDIYWPTITDQNTSRYAIEYSLDDGKIWKNITTNYDSLGCNDHTTHLTFDRIKTPNVIYRWARINLTGDKTQIIVLGNLNCYETPFYEVYPNPFTNELKLCISTSIENPLEYTFEISNLYGQVQYSNVQKLSEYKTNILIDNLNKLVNGVYIFYIKQNNKVAYSSILIKLQ